MGIPIRRPTQDEWIDTPTPDHPVSRGSWQQTPLWMRALFSAQPHRRRLWKLHNGITRRAWEYDDCTIMAHEILQKRFDPDVPRQGEGLGAQITATELRARARFNSPGYGKVR